MGESNQTCSIKILGIDPGTIITGYGILSSKGNSLEVHDYGCIKPPVSYKLSDRYHIIDQAIESLIDAHSPDVLVVETQFINKTKSIDSVIKLGMARGIAVVAAKRKGLEVFVYAPTEAKRAVVGNGRASKTQVQGMIQRLLCLQETPPEDAADALALAICHAHASTRGLNKKNEF
jgi:crossover junction endodeoxyribonuclease RuvC